MPHACNTANLHGTAHPQSCTLLPPGPTHALEVDRSRSSFPQTVTLSTQQNRLPVVLHHGPVIGGRD